MTDPITTAASVVSSASEINIGAIIAAVLGGALFTLIVGLLIFYIRRRGKRKKLSLTPTTSTVTTTSLSSSTSTEPVVVPALYDISYRRTSSVISAETVTYHLYEELL